MDALGSRIVTNLSFIQIYNIVFWSKYLVSVKLVGLKLKPSTFKAAQMLQAAVSCSQIFPFSHFPLVLVLKPHSSSHCQELSWELGVTGPLTPSVGKNVQNAHVLFKIPQ